MNVEHSVPAYSQHLHIRDQKWRKSACGVVSLAMLLNYFNKNTSPDDILARGLTCNAYLPKTGWKHKELAEIAKQYNLNGETFDWAYLDQEAAFENAKEHLNRHPILASVYRSFDPQNGGHLIVLTGMENSAVFYNDPDSRNEAGISGSVPLEKFLVGWKRRIIAITP